ncbi:MAG: leucyl aminopeptidase family protein [Pseudomonadota bacterium]
MSSLLTDKFSGNNLRVTQATGDLSAKSLSSIDQLILVLPDRTKDAVWRKVPSGARIKALLRRRKKGAIPAVSTRLNNKRQTAVHVATLGAGGDAFDRLTRARRLVTAALREKGGSLGICVLGFDEANRERWTRDVVRAALAVAFPMPHFKAEPSPPAIRSLRVLGLADKLDLASLEAEASGNNLARWLTALPANVLDAPAYVALLKELATEHGWQFKRYSTAELRKLGAGAFLAVAQGNADDSAAIVRLRYRPANAKRHAPLALIGKGIIFDTGGTNLKPFMSMLDMHIDMGGSAVAVGTLLALSSLGVSRPIDCWLAITENRTGPTAYKSQDVVTAANGKTIQTIHTDAEGRMALADTLVLAGREKPELIVDFATLTGACINAVTTRYSGVFTNRVELHPVLKRSGQECGERVWPFPMGKEFLEELKSETADLRQCSPNGGGDHILAASFLNEFVEPSIPWIHIDLSATTRKGGLAHIPSEITGFGVRYSLHLLLNNDPMKHVAS